MNVLPTASAVTICLDFILKPSMSAPDPIAQFAQWYAKARASEIDKPHAMALSTVAADGRPSCRMVLLSSFDERGFVFHTNYDSRKSEEIARNNRVTLTFWWDPLGYQVRIEGPAEKTTGAESDAYFARRPRGSQLGAWASDQSRPMENRAALEQRMRDFEEQFKNQAVGRPPHWGGYRVVPHAIEFWRHRDDRLHERMRYDRDGAGAWRTVLLAP